MSRKALRVQVQLDLQAVTCPGVWLCPNGKVSLQMYMLDSCIQTTALCPVFPLLYHEQFIFYKTFYSAHTLIDLQRYIDKDFLYAELVQWQNGDVGNVIASFQTSLHEVLYPSSLEGTLSGIDIDLLMEPSKNFPGIISPKIEISTRTTVEQIVCNNDYTKADNFVINPKTISSDYVPKNMKRKSKPPRQKRVCHSLEYYKTKTCVPSKNSAESKPPFLYRKVDETLLSRKPQGIENDVSKKHKCRTCLEVKKLEVPSQLLNRNSSKLINSYSFDVGKTPKLNKRKEPCACDSSHTGDSCPLCAKYSSYFDNGRVTNVNYCNIKTGNPFVRKLNKTNPLREETSRKSCGCSNYSNKTRPSSPLVFDSNESKEYDINPSSKESPCNNRLCIHCSQFQKPSVAKQIHRRLKQALHCTDNYEEEHAPSSGSASACCSPRFRNCDRGFYKNLGKFYRDLYRC